MSEAIRLWRCKFCKPVLALQNQCDQGLKYFVKIFACGFQNGVSSRVVNQLLTEMDGVEGRAAVFLMAASNRPDIIDPAVLRPGRLDKIVYVGMPNAEDRKDILRALTKVLFTSLLLRR